MASPRPESVTPRLSNPAVILSLSLYAAVNRQAGEAFGFAVLRLLIFLRCRPLKQNENHDEPFKNLASGLAGRQAGWLPAELDGWVGGIM